MRKTKEKMYGKHGEIIENINKTWRTHHHRWGGGGGADKGGCAQTPALLLIAAYPTHKLCDYKPSPKS